MNSVACSDKEKLEGIASQYEGTELSPRQAQIWAGWFDLGWKPKQIGAVLNLDPSAVRVMLNKIGEKLRRDQSIVSISLTSELQWAVA